jgi:hypothetical protein
MSQEGQPHDPPSLDMTPQLDEITSEDHCGEKNDGEYDNLEATASPHEEEAEAEKEETAPLLDQEGYSDENGAQYTGTPTTAREPRRRLSFSWIHNYIWQPGYDDDDSDNDDVLQQTLYHRMHSDTSAQVDGSSSSAGMVLAEWWNRWLHRHRLYVLGGVLGLVWPFGLYALHTFPSRTDSTFVPVPTSPVGEPFASFVVPIPIPPRGEISVFLIPSILVSLWFWITLEKAVTPQH